MSFHNPDVMAVGSAKILVPRGEIPADLWVEFAKIVLLEPEPKLADVWGRRLEASLGVTDADRRAIARAELMPFPGEARETRGHALTVLDDEAKKRGASVWRHAGMRPIDEHLEWYLVRCATRQEARAEQRLVDADFAVYLPRMKRWNRLATTRARSAVEQPLFTGYLFVGLYPDQSLKDVEAIEYVHAVVRFGGECFPTPISFRGAGHADPEQLTIAATLQLELDGEFDRTRRHKRKEPEKGTPLRIIRGPFSGFDAAFVQRREDERIEVLFSLFGRPGPLVLNPEDLAGMGDED